ncbi:hypothetical protein D3C72_2118620 [compost metagenome]
MPDGERFSFVKPEPDAIGQRLTLNNSVIIVVGSTEKLPPYTQGAVLHGWQRLPRHFADGVSLAGAHEPILTDLRRAV